MPLLWSPALNLFGPASTHKIRLLEELELFHGNGKPRLPDLNSRILKIDKPLQEAFFHEKLTAISASPSQALEGVMCGYALWRLADVFPQSDWESRLDELCRIVEAAAELSVFADPLTYQLLAVELPLLLVWRFPHILAKKDFAPQAMADLEKGLSHITDKEGLPQVRLITNLQDLLSCWTRSLFLARAVKAPSLTKKAQRRFARFVEQYVRMIYPQGRFPFVECTAQGTPTEDDQSPGKLASASRELLIAALQLAKSGRSLRAARSALAGPKPFGAISAFKSKPKAKNKVGDPESVKQKSTSLPPVAIHSEDRGLATMRSSWKRGSEVLTVGFAQEQIWLDLHQGKQPVFCGPASPSVTIDDQKLTPTTPWEVLCWHSDDDVHYLEIETQLGAKKSSGWKLQRQHLLARDDRFLFLADAVIGPETAKINYRGDLTLAPGVEFVSALETHEGRLVAEHDFGWIAPLAQPEWRAGSTSQGLATSPGPNSATFTHSVNGRPLLTLNMTAHAPRLYAPLFISLRRLSQQPEITWRRLTVAESLNIQMDDSAVGYRVQHGRRQWMFYRSLGPTGNRTVLGQNLTTEFLAARFLRDGSVEHLIEIE